jgi:hypothetical protein
MATSTQEQFLNDLLGKIQQYVYRSSEAHLDALVSSLQTYSGNGNLNWHLTDNKVKLASVFTGIATAITNYNLNDGDFRTYLLLQYVSIVVSTYQQELFNLYVSQGYNMTPESIVGQLSEAYSTQPFQNTNFPDITNTSQVFEPEPSGVRLVPSSLYINSGSADLDNA